MNEKPKFKKGAEVFLPRQNLRGIIKDYCWIYHLDTYQYLVEIKGKKMMKMCWEKELGVYHD